MEEHQRTARGATLLDDTVPDNTGPDNTGPDNTGPDNTGPDNTGPDNTGPDNTGPDNTVLGAEPVPHAEPLTDEQLNQQISETIPEVIKQIHDVGQSIATEFGLTGSDAMALFKLDAPMTMKELGQRMGCDPSFITTIADALEKHGLARREPSLRDRRSKNIVLTPEGVTVRDRLCAELMARAPWCTGLDTGERRCLLGLMRKMLRSCGGR
jgi:MarR family transcriptional regulator, organic hydroperoxide resistance regulator